MKHLDHPNSTSQTPSPESNAETSAIEESCFEHRLAKIRDQITKRESILQKSQARAHFAVGKIVMSDPVLRSLTATNLERHLAKMGPARKAVDDYDQTARELAKLKALRP